MSPFKSTKASRVLAALERIGWRVKRGAGTSHKVLERAGWPNYVFAFHDRDEIGPVMLKRISKHTGLTPEDL
ncbi:MAG: type II toxin-antitoxin system HicA family toxin [Deltaproteobacteria bacterium]|nr:type II toxin-antitoxin system HicA family toxin [Deltaproteobacteria bacterium]